MVALPPIILIEDNPDDIYLFERLLIRGGIKNPVVPFAYGRDVVAHLEDVAIDPRKRPAAIFCDGCLPGARAPEIVKRLRANEALRTTAIVVLSGGLEDDELRDAALGCGADAVFLKFPAPSQLAAFVAGHR